MMFDYWRIYRKRKSLIRKRDSAILYMREHGFKYYDAPSIADTQLQINELSEELRLRDAQAKNELAWTCVAGLLATLVACSQRATLPETVACCCIGMFFGYIATWK